MIEFEEIVLNENRWPWFSEVTHLNKLIDIAADSYHKHTVEGYLASILIYHQVAEEMVKVLLETNQFFIKAKLHPIEFKSRKISGVMFGRLHEELKGTVDFKFKDGLIQILHQFNALRISTVHGLTDPTTMNQIEGRADEVQHLFSRIFQYFDFAIAWYRENLWLLRKEKFWMSLAKKKRKIK